MAAMAEGREDARAARQARLIAALDQGLDLRRACRMAGVSMRSALRWRKDDVDFAARLAEAHEAGVVALEAEAHRRAMAGSDKLIVFLLCAYAPERFSLAGQIARVREGLGRASAQEIAAAMREAQEAVALSVTADAGDVHQH
jgi:hypothetical protein